MLEIKEVEESTKLKVAVETSRMSGGNYVDVAREFLSSTTIKLTDDEITDFLDHFEWDTKLIVVIFNTGSATAELSLIILKRKRFNETLCVSAGNANRDNEEFIITLIVNAHSIKPKIAISLTKQFVQQISPNGAICLHTHTGSDPDISNILSPILGIAS